MRSRHTSSPIPLNLQAKGWQYHKDGLLWNSNLRYRALRAWEKRWDAYMLAIGAVKDDIYEREHDEEEADYGEDTGDDEDNDCDNMKEHHCSRCCNHNGCQGEHSNDKCGEQW